MMKKYFWAILISVMFVACAGADEVPTQDISEEFWHDDANDTLNPDEGQNDVSPDDVVQDDVAGDALFDVGQDGHYDDSVTTDEGTVEDDVGIPTDVKTDIMQDVRIPTTEECDGEDNDCDGLMDESDSIGCSVYYEDRDKDGFGVGSGKCLCSTTGYYTASVNGDCDDTDKAANPDKSEICNNTDDDCDGQTDEDLVQDCTVTNDAGTCRGTEACAAGGWFGCTAIAPGIDNNCDGIDDDCNGPADDGWEEYGTDCSVQECIRTGVMTCVEGNEVDTCVPIELSEDSDCDNLDDDCDGETDEHYQSHEVTCGFDACEDTGTTSCTGGAETDTCTYRFKGTAFEGNVCDEPVNVGLMIPEPTGDQKYQIRLTTKKIDGYFHTGLRALWVPSSSSVESAWDSDYDEWEDYYELLEISSSYEISEDGEVLSMTLTWGVTDYDYPLTVILTNPVPDTVLEVLIKGSDNTWELMPSSDSHSQKVLTETGCTKAFLTLKMQTPVESLHEVMDGTCLE